MAMHRQSGEMERKAVNCMEVHSADWISILYERSRVCAYVTGREHARPFDVSWRKRANGYCSRHTQNDTDRKLKTSFPAGNVHRMLQKRFDIKFINEFVNEKAAIPPRSVKRGTLYTRNLKLAKLRTSFFRVRKKLFFKLRTYTRSREAGFGGAWKLLLTRTQIGWCVACVKRFLPSVP